VALRHLQRFVKWQISAFDTGRRNGSNCINISIGISISNMQQQQQHVAAAAAAAAAAATATAKFLIYEFITISTVRFFSLLLFLF
jgi:hypothetical protein